MNALEFEKIFEETVKLSRDVLVVKAAEYADEDRLVNFKRGANLTGETTVEVLAGYMTKHTISIYDMMGSGKEFSMDKWDEKILDHINYLILLRCLLKENE